MTTYKIIRFYVCQNRSRVVRRGLTLTEAQAHCNDPKTCKPGFWFDGYEQEEIRKQRR